MSSEVNLSCHLATVENSSQSVSKIKARNLGLICHLFIFSLIIFLCHPSYAQTIESPSTVSLINLLNQRFALIEQVAANKRDNIDSVYDANREKQVLENAKYEAELNHLDVQRVLQFAQIMMDVSKQLEYAYIMHWQAKHITPKVKYSLTQIRGKLLAIDSEIATQLKQLVKQKEKFNLNSQSYKQAIKLPSSLGLYQSMLLSSLTEVIVSGQEP